MVGVNLAFSLDMLAKGQRIDAPTTSRHVAESSGPDALGA
jgi:hypothetical protein